MGARFLATACLVFAASAAQAERPQGFAELSLAANVCGASGRADCDQASTGFGGDIRGGWWPFEWLGVGATLGYSGLPDDKTSAGLLFVAPELTTGYAWSKASIDTALAVGYDRLGGEGEAVSGLGALRWRIGGRWFVHRNLHIGLDYALLIPRFGDQRCSGDRCGAVVAANVHQFGLIVGVPFW